MRSHQKYCCGLLVFAANAIVATLGRAQDLPDGTEAATKQTAAFRVPAGMTVDLFAAEPKLASPVAIGLDEHNRVFVAEEYRFNLGTEENRTRPFLLEDDLQLQTTEDRLRMYEKWATKFEGGMEWFKKTADQVRLVEDTDGDGRADRSTVFAPGFNGTLDGMAAGVMATDGDVFFTCIPNLWRLRDTNGDGVADERTVMQSGFGVNAGFLGHDLHGLCWGPDGKLYFSVGDRGFHLRTREGMTLHGPRNGAIFRCLPDGSEMEVVMRGLRNPQEIIFDKYGNLFADDNNCDKGDHSRLVYVIEGGHSGWNMAFQSLPEPYLTGPWHAEKMWHLPESHPKAAGAAEVSSAATPVATDDRPAWLLPPVGKLGAGPSGFTYYPGTGLAERYDHHFFLCNYTGNGGIESFSIVPRGAGFEIVDEHDFLKPVFATDCEFGYDGRLYVSDFVNLIWEGGSSGGRIYRVTDPANQSAAVVTETTSLMRAGLKGLPPQKLSELLGHADQRIRQRAQFALAAQGESSTSIFNEVVSATNPLLKRLHGIWGLGQIATAAHRTQLAASSQPNSGNPPLSGRVMQQTNMAAEALTLLLNDDDSEVRAQALRTLGDLRYQPAAVAVTAKLKDADPRVRMFAALAVGRMKYAAALPDVIELLRTNGHSDPWLRHAGVMALAGIKDRSALSRYATDQDPVIRMTVLLTVRKWLLESQENWISTEVDEIPAYSPDSADVDSIVAFLIDSDRQVVAEAARAINDLPLESATQTLAELVEKEPAQKTGLSPLSTMPDSLLRRIVNANFRLGDVVSLQRILVIAQSSLCSFAVRQEALQALIDWAEPSSRDRVTGFWRPLTARDAEMMKRCREVLADQLPALLATTPDTLQGQLVTLIDRHQLPIDDGEFAAWVTDSSKSSSVRVAALRLLAARESLETWVSIDAALVSDVDLLRAEARDLLLKLEPDRGRGLLIEIAQSAAASILERQRAIIALATLQQEQADAVLLTLARQLADETLAPALSLEVIEAATLRNTTELKSLVDQFKAKQSGNGLLAQYQAAVEGGSPDQGRSLFVGHRVAQCVRCHKVGSTDVGRAVVGGNAGPDLNQVAKRHDRASLLQSLVEPSAKIAKGFESVTIVLQSGQLVAGLIRSEENGMIMIEQPDGKLVTISADDVEDRTTPKSAMPEMHRALTLRELRDLVEYLSTLQ
ncbi:MAG: HEAT repeat domain-containing protein [Planctomycetales bacterium]|nr:HEAT repeat domain-containing protein [Planctomycetales bacterium]